MTDLGCGTPPVDLLEVFAIPEAFVFQDSREHAPTGIPDGFRQFVISHHVSRRQVFQNEPITLGYHAMGQLMQKIFALVSRSAVQSRELLLVSQPAPATFRLAG